MTKRRNPLNLPPGPLLQPVKWPEWTAEPRRKPSPRVPETPKSIALEMELEALYNEQVEAELDEKRVLLKRNFDIKGKASAALMKALEALTPGFQVIRRLRKHWKQTPWNCWSYSILIINTELALRAGGHKFEKDALKDIERKGRYLKADWRSLRSRLSDARNQKKNPFFDFFPDIKEWSDEGLRTALAAAEHEEEAERAATSSA